jgi:hypothetical protein
MTAAEREKRGREALAQITPAGTYGELLSETAEDDGVYTMLFAATMGGYPGWHWTVSLAELPGEEPTVLETELMPGDGALLAPDWVPWSERLEEYRAAQAAAGEPDETVDLTEEDDEDHLDDDHGDDPDDGIDFESSDLLAVGEDEQDEAESESDEGSPEPPAVAALEDGREEDE